MTDIIRSPEMYRRDRILDDWLEQIDTGQTTVEECLAQHPELRDEMEPVLRSARQLFAGEVTPLSAAKVRAIRGRVFDRVAPAAQQRAPSGGLWLTPTWARLAGAVAVLLLVLGVGLAGAWRVSADSLPGNPLYLLKRGAETVQLAFTANPADSARLHLTFALRRLDEGLGLKQPERTMAEAAGELQRAEETLNQAQQLGAPIDWDAVARLSATGERELAGVAGGDSATVQASGILRDLQQRARRRLGSGGPVESTAVPAPSAPSTEPRDTPPPSRPAPSNDARSTGVPGPATTGPGPGHNQQDGPGHYGPSDATEVRPDAGTPGPAASSQPGTTPRSTAGVEAPIPVTRANAGGIRGVFATATSRPTAIPTIAPTLEPTAASGQDQGNGPEAAGNSTGGLQNAGGDNGSSGGGSGGSSGGGSGGSSGGGSGGSSGGGSSGSGGGGNGSGGSGSGGSGGGGGSGGKK